MASRTARPDTTSPASPLLRAGLPVTTPGVTVNRYCNSGLQAIVQAAHLVLHEGVDAAIGGGVESITMMERDNTPNPWIVEHLPALYMAMGDTAEVVAKRYNDQPRRAGRIFAREPAAHRARATGGILRRRTGAASRCAAPCSTRKPDKSPAKKTRASTRRVQSCRTRLSKGWRSCRRCSTRPAARARSQPATHLSSPMARPRRS